MRTEGGRKAAAVARRAGSGHTGAGAPPRTGPAGTGPAAIGATIEYEIVRSARRRKTIEISLDGRGVRVAAPLRTSPGEIEEFVRRRVPWILKQQHARAQRAAPPAFEDGETLPFAGRALPLLVRAWSGHDVAVTLDLFNLHIAVPAALAGARRRQAIEGAMLAWYRERAEQALAASATRWAQVVQRWPRRVLVRDQRRRWGSCGPDGTLRLNWRLVMLDPELMDYVVVHELTHLLVPHHGPAFWRALERVLPDHAERRRRMREVAATLPF